MNISALSPRSVDESAHPATQPTATRVDTDGRRARTIRTRDALLAACREFLIQGAFQPPMKDICKLAGLVPRTGFQHFASTEALRLAAIKDDGGIIEGMLAQLIGAPNPLSPNESARICRALVTGRAA